MATATKSTPKPGDYRLSADWFYEGRRIARGTRFAIVRYEGDLALVDFGSNRVGWYKPDEVAEMLTPRPGTKLAVQVAALAKVEVERGLSLKVPASVHAMLVRQATREGRTMQNYLLVRSCAGIEDEIDRHAAYRLKDAEPLPTLDQQIEAQYRKAK